MINNIKKENIFTFIIEDIFSTKDNNLALSGIVKGTKIHPGDNIYILGINKRILSTKVKEIRDVANSPLPFGNVNSNVELIIDNINDSKVFKYDVVTNTNPNIENKANLLVKNIRLNALLESWKKNDDLNLINNIVDEIVTDTYFLSPIVTNKSTKDVSFLLITNKNKENFFPIFTNLENLKKVNNRNDQEILLLNIENYLGLLQNQANSNVEGVLINPTDSSFKITKEQLEEFIQKRDQIKVKKY